MVVVFHLSVGYETEPPSFGLRERINQELFCNDRRTGTLNLLNRQNNKITKKKLTDCNIHISMLGIHTSIISSLGSFSLRLTTFKYSESTCVEITGYRANRLAAVSRLFGSSLLWQYNEYVCINCNSVIHNHLLRRD